VKTTGPSLVSLLVEHKNPVVIKWLESILKAYPNSAGNFLSQEGDPFRNPVGYTLREGLSFLFDRLMENAEAAAMKPVLDGIVRIRAVQDISASQATAFVFGLKGIIRAELSDVTARFGDELAALDCRIDEMALLAFDVFMKCREQIYEIRANERKRMAFLLERTHSKETAGSTE
jgi:hypothetical protein